MRDSARTLATGATTEDMVTADILSVVGGRTGGVYERLRVLITRK